MMRKWLPIVLVSLLAIPVILYAVDSASPRKAQARKLVARFDTLTETECKTLASLGDDAFDALLPLVRKRLASYEACASSDRETSEKLYEAYSNAADALHYMAAKKHTSTVVELLKQAKKPDAQCDILCILGCKGDPAITTPIFLEILKTQKHDPMSLRSPIQVALGAISSSSDSRAVQFLMDQLADPKADPWYRGTAFISLPGVGGEKGVKAVIAAKDRNRRVPSFAQLMRLDELGLKPFKAKEGEFVWKWESPTKLIAVSTDDKGVQWGLISSLALGSDKDAWVARYDGKQWITPLFTGADINALQKDDWVGKFAHSAAIAADADADGWTDLIEQRLGTDPQKPDTDGDGLKDSEDKNPMVAPRRLSESERVLAAAFEAEFNFDQRRPVPVIVTFPSDTKPFELPGWNQVIIAQTGQQDTPLRKQYERGVALVEFQSNTRGNRATTDGQIISWSKNNTEAKLVISAYYSGTDGTGYEIWLRKYGDEWLVIAMRQLWIS